MKALPSVLCASFLAVFLAAMPASAVEFKVGSTELTVGGSARLDSGWLYNDKGDVAPGEPGTNSKMFVTIPSDTNVFVRAKNNNLLAHVELGLLNPHLDIYDSGSSKCWSWTF